MVTRTDESEADIAARIAELETALRHVILHIDHRRGLSHRMDLFTRDERDYYKRILGDSSIPPSHA